MLKCSQDSIVSIVIILEAGWLRCSITKKGKKFFSSAFVYRMLVELTQPITELVILVEAASPQ